MAERTSGILLHITSLPGPYGIGDLGPEAYAFADLLAGAQQSYWQILPLNPTNQENGHSPYFSSSALAGNPLLISFDLLIKEGLLTHDDIGTILVTSAEETRYDELSGHKEQVLAKAYRRFLERPDKTDYDRFCAENSSWLDDYALFTAIKEESGGKIWNEWPEELRDRKPEALEAARGKHAETIAEEKFLQYVFDRQWTALKKYCNGKGIKIIGDIPIYVSYDSVDVWVEPDIFKLDDDKRPFVVSGVPPDYFSATGQLWNNPVYRWDVLKETGYKWWIKRFEGLFSRVDLTRIDHFRGLVQYWEVPAEEDTAINGKWQDVPTYDFLDTLIKRFRDFPVIAEDLGIITPDVRKAMEHYGFPGMKVLLFAFGNNDPKHPYLPHNYERNCIVYTGTHDNNTLMGWFNDEIEDKEKERLLSYLYMKDRPCEINWELIRLAMLSVADTAIVPLQDIVGLGADARMNQPAKVFGNWKWRLAPGQLKLEHCERLKELTELYGRARA